MDDFLRIFGGTDKIWGYIKKYASQSGREVTKMMLELFYVLKSPSTTTLDKTLIVGVLAYQLLPEDVLPRDKYGLFSVLDNGVTLAFAYNKVKASVTPEISNQVESVLNQWFGGTSLCANETAVSINEQKGDMIKHCLSPQGNHSTHTYQMPLQGNLNEQEDVIID